MTNVYLRNKRLTASLTLNKKLLQWKMSNAIDIDSLLDPQWSPYLKDTILSNPDSIRFLHTSRQYMIPKLENTFQALKLTSPQDCTVVIFGQDPYPRAESAIGIAFCDGEIKKWTDPLCPSLRNVFKSVLIHYKYLNPSSKVGDLRKEMARIKMISPYQWFFETAKKGVLWLNTSLTYTSDVSFFSFYINLSISVIFFRGHLPITQSFGDQSFNALLLLSLKQKQVFLVMIIVVI